MKKRFSIKSRAISFKNAFNGLKLFLITQHNAWIHTAVLVLVIILGCWLKINIQEWLAIIFAAGLVFVTEIVNTAIEFLTDHVSPDYHENAAKVKDIAAAAVLVASLIAAMIGCLIFIPKLFV